MLRRAVGACTESLGSDNGDVDGFANAEIISLLCRPPPLAASAAAAEECEEEEAPAPEEGEEEGRMPRRRGLFPPAMPRAAEALVMRTERRGGRLILTEVLGAELELREVFRASRDGGRLRLHFTATAAARKHPASAAAPDAAAACEPPPRTEQRRVLPL